MYVVVFFADTTRELFGPTITLPGCMVQEVAPLVRQVSVALPPLLMERGVTENSDTMGLTYTIQL